MLNIPIPPMDAFKLGERYSELTPGGQQQVVSENGAPKIGPCVGCGRGTMSAITSARMDAEKEIDVCAHRICAPCHRRWPGCPHTWDEALLAMMSLGSTVNE